MYISDFKDFKYNYKINLAQKNISMDLNIKQINSDPNTLYIKKFGNQLITDIIDSYYSIIESSFENNDFDKSLKYSSFYIDYNIVNPYISFIYVFSYYKLNPESLNTQYLDILKKNIIIAKSIINMFNIEHFNNYCNFILNQNQ